MKNFDYSLHPSTRQQLEAALAHPAHAYIFHGPAYLYKLRSAEVLARQLAGAESLDHPNILRVAPADSGSLKLAMVKELLEQLSRTAFDTAHQRVVIIESADSLTADAAGALLKFLEEPGDNIVFLLVSTRLQSILPTLRSRSQLISFLPLEEQGNRYPALVEVLGTDPAFRERYHKALEVVDGFIKGGITERFAIAKEVVEAKIEQLFFSIMEEALHPIHSPTAARQARLLFHVEDAVRHNVNARLCLEQLALELAI